MKWIDVRNNNPPKDGYYIVAWQSNEENSNDIFYEGCHYQGDEWFYVTDDKIWTMTHFIIPDPFPTPDENLRILFTIY